MRVVIIGGSGHVGSYMVPMLVERGHEVINITRGQRQPYVRHAAWKEVREIVADRDGEDAAGTFGARIRDLKADVVIDMICFTEPSARQIVEALRGSVQQFLHCGTIWVYGHSTVVPATEDQKREPFGDYGIQKSAIQNYLLYEARQNGFPATVLQPGHIVGPGWVPLNPQGSFNSEIYAQIARGLPLTLPNLGLETVHHVHAADVAQAFVKAMAHWSASVGEAFHTVSPGALTLRGYAEAMYKWFGHEPNLRYAPWEEFRQQVSQAESEATWDHIAHSPNASIAKAERLIDYRPRYSSLEGVQESVTWLVEHGIVGI